MSEMHDDKAREDAPRYRVSETNLVCRNCIFGQQPLGFCDRYKFPYDLGFICDAWQPVPLSQGEQMNRNGKHEYKTVPAFGTKITDLDQGVVEHIFAVFGNIDDGKDIAHPGSFTKTLAERGAKVRVLDNHNADSIMSVIGKPLSIREISREELPTDLLQRFPDASGGVQARTQFLLDTPEGKGAFERIKAGAVDEWSFGYDALDVDFSKATRDGKEFTVRNLRTVKLYEYSPVLWGMNAATVTLGIKAVTSFGDLPLADRQRAWDSTAADARVRSWAGVTDAPNAKFAHAFMWHDSEAPELFGSYKLGFADVVDGRLTALPRGLFAVAGVLEGARGGTDIPQADQDRIKGVTGRYYGKMRRQFDDDSIVPPWDKAGGEPSEGKNLALRAAVEMINTGNQLLQAAMAEEQMNAAANPFHLPGQDDDEEDDKQMGGYVVPPDLAPIIIKAAEDGQPIEMTEEGKKEFAQKILDAIKTPHNPAPPTGAADDEPNTEAGPDTKPSTSKMLMEVELELLELELLEV